ncbi:MAG: segregation/condensation protein A [Candidatus Bathyarchaeota archaeon]
MNSQAEKPFYLRHPWQILFDLVKLYKIQPWSLDIAYLLSSFLSEMRNKGYIDFAASGTALLSSSIVLRLQSEHILELEKPVKPKEVTVIQDYIPPPLKIPLRVGISATTLSQLLETLKETLENEKNFVRHNVRLIPVESPPPEFFKDYNEFMAEIEAKIEEFYEILKYKHGEKHIAFSSIVEGKTKHEIVRIFLFLLFLASKGLVELYQEENFGEIYVVITAGTQKHEEPTKG